MTEIFSKVYNEDKTRSYRIKTEWEEGYFRLFIFEGTNSWFALVTNENIKMLAEQHELEPGVYFNNLREYICNNQSSISFNIVKKQFIIFRSIEKEKFRIKYFFVNLETLNYQETIESVVDDLSAKDTEMQAKVKALEEQKLEIQSQKLLYERKLEEFVELKRKSDLQMYSTFALSLNEKKHRIRFLTELLDEYQTGGKQKFIPGIATSSSTRKREDTKVKPIPASASTSSSSTNRPKETISDSESNPSDDYNTDDEENAKEDAPVPGTSRDNLDFLGGDSPPPVSLPKRIRSNASQASKVKPEDKPAKDLKQQVKANGSKEEPMDTQEAGSDNELEKSVDFNTQDLWDRM